MMKHREILTYKYIIYIYIFEIYFEIEYPSNNLSPLEQILRQMNIAIIIYSHTNSCIYIYISTFESYTFFRNRTNNHYRSN